MLSHQKIRNFATVKISNVAWPFYVRKTGNKCMKFSFTISSCRSENGKRLQRDCLLAHPVGGRVCEHMTDARNMRVCRRKLETAAATAAANHRRRIWPTIAYDRDQDLLYIVGIIEKQSIHHASDVADLDRFPYPAETARTSHVPQSAVYPPNPNLRSPDRNVRYCYVVGLIQFLWCNIYAGRPTAAFRCTCNCTWWWWAL